MLEAEIRWRDSVVIILWYAYIRSGVLYSKATRLLLYFIMDVWSFEWNVYLDNCVWLYRCYVYMHGNSYSCYIWKSIKVKMFDAFYTLFIWVVQPLVGGNDEYFCRLFLFSWDVLCNFSDVRFPSCASVTPFIQRWT